VPDVSYHPPPRPLQIDYLKTNIDGLSKVVAGKQDNLESVVRMIQMKTGGGAPRK
jgi:hypothetical protein